MKVLFFEPYTLATPHFETALELMQNHLNNGDELFFFHCNANLKFCEANPGHSLNTCVDCISRRYRGVSLLDNVSLLNRQVFLDLNNSEKEIIRNWNIPFSNIEELKSFTYEEIDLGMSVASSLISQLRDPEPDTIIHRELINKIFHSSLRVYFSFKKHLLEIRPAIVYLFNGRFANLRVVLRLCEKHKITYRIHERGSSKRKYNLYENHLPHSIKSFQDNINRQWDNETNTIQKEFLATEFYQKRKNGAEQSWFSFIKNQKINELPQSWNPDRRNVIIFNSSEDEFAAIGSEFHNDPFTSQLEAIAYIVARLSDNVNVFIYLRVHPNLKGIVNSSVTNLLGIKAPNFEIIPPESSISTYKLLDECDAVVTFGSTMGAEATFWDKPSILIGNTFYRSLDVTYSPETQNQLIDFILNVKEPKPKIGALKYGYYLNTYGIDYQYYQPVELFNGKFKGVTILPNKRLRKIFKYRIIKQVAVWFSEI